MTEFPVAGVGALNHPGARGVATGAGPAERGDPTGALVAGGAEGGGDVVGRVGVAAGRGVVEAGVPVGRGGRAAEWLEHGAAGGVVIPRGEGFLLGGVGLMEGQGEAAEGEGDGLAGVVVVEVQEPAVVPEDGGLDDGADLAGFGAEVGGEGEVVV